jgi:hypothetical protein
MNPIYLNLYKVTSNAPFNVEQNPHVSYIHVLHRVSYLCSCCYNFPVPALTAASGHQASKMSALLCSLSEGGDWLHPACSSAARTFRVMNRATGAGGYGATGDVKTDTSPLGEGFKLTVSHLVPRYGDRKTQAPAAGGRDQHGSPTGHRNKQ